MLVPMMLFAIMQPGPSDVYIRVVDVGPGLCTITEAPGEHYMIYDAGHWTGSNCLEAAQEIVDPETIDLMILSHSDGDHLGEAAEILNQFEIQTIIVTGDPRDSNVWEETYQSNRGGGLGRAGPYAWCNE